MNARCKPWGEVDASQVGPAKIKAQICTCSATCLQLPSNAKKSLLLFFDLGSRTATDRLALSSAAGESF